jgi:hypothetical protein
VVPMTLYQCLMIWLDFNALFVIAMLASNGQ